MTDLRDTLKAVRDAIVRADIDTLWMPDDSGYMGGTVVDFIDTALAEEPLRLSAATASQNAALILARRHLVSLTGGDTSIVSQADQNFIDAALAEEPQPDAAFQLGLSTAIRFVEKRRDAYVEEHGNYDPHTGVTEFPGNGDDTVAEWDEIIEGLKALKS